MKFFFRELLLWKSDDNIRTVQFLPNKVNVITGESHTGKTAILGIIDYCLFASEHKIPQSVINDAIQWYGIRFDINGKTFTIARRAPRSGKVSTDYFFSSIGKIPGLPNPNHSESALKTTMEVEFSIDGNTVMPFGGGSISANSKISLRYFLMFNTISEDIIENSGIFFDKQNIDRYREALPRIFDLAVGIDDVRNILARERKDYLEREIRRLQRKRDRIDNYAADFEAEIGQIARQANEYAVIKASASEEVVISELQSAVSRASEAITAERAKEESADTWERIYDSLTSEIYAINAKMRNAKRFTQEYAIYKDNLKNAQDSLKPIMFLHNRNRELVKTSIFEDIIEALARDFYSIKKAIATKTPIDIKITDLLASLESERSNLERQRERLGPAPKALKNEKEKFFFLGEVKAKLELYKAASNKPAIKTDILERLEDELASLEVKDVTGQRELFAKMFEEIVFSYMELTGDAIANYRNYRPVFNFNEKKLQLRKPKSDEIEYIGSSSNHMFLHLYFFLGLHEVILRKSVPFVPPFLIIDQPSRPYYGTDNTKLRKNSDEANIRLAFELLDHFIDNATVELKRDFQIIVFEHVPPTTWKGMENVHLVEQFEGGNALIN